MIIVFVTDPVNYMEFKIDENFNLCSVNVFL